MRRARRSSLRTPHSALRTGFTLVEMLVAVGLVVLMMSLFATIFQMATSAMATQKGIAENDQKVRLVLTILRDDLNNRAMKTVLPFFPGDSNVTDRSGYLYISENDPDDDTDDVLQFVVTAPISEDLFYGRAAWLGGTIGSDPQQPEFDDGYADPNGSGSSPNAEVCYFLRQGVLYRRALLLRQPIIAIDAGAHPYNPQSGSTGSADIPLTVYQSGATGTSNFYSDFDYSAHYDGAGPAFHGVNDLSNATGGTAFPLGKPNNRFGFNYANGLPREHSNRFISAAGLDNLGPRFFGRFTQEETSFFRLGTSPLVSFGYPGRVAGTESPNPYDTGTTITLDTQTGRVTQYEGGTRIAEDILMTGVQRFDVKVFDPGASLGPDAAPGNVGDDNLANGAEDFGEIGWPGSDDGDFRDLGHSGFLFAGSDRSFFSRNAVSTSQTPQFCPTNPLKAGTLLYRFDTWHPEVNLNGTGAGFDQPPFRCRRPGNDNQPGIAGVDDNLANGVDDDGELGWPNSDDLSFPLRAIQIRITFFDQTSQQLRDVTLVQSLE